MELRQTTNDEFTLYEGELAFRHRSSRGINEVIRIVNHFQNYLGMNPPTPELTKSFLSTSKDSKLKTIARYTATLDSLPELDKIPQLLLPRESEIE